MRCLGTPIESATDDGRMRTVLLSDLHLTRDGGEPLAAFERVLADARAAAGTTRVVVLGDLFDVYLKDRQLTMPRWDDVARALATTTAAGVSVTVLHGNRDFLLGGGFAAATGCRVVAGGLRLELGGRPVLCLHGDELCTRDVGYQRLKRVVRQPAVRFLARRLPDAWVFRAGDRVRQGSRQHQAMTTRIDTDAAAAAVDRAFAEAEVEVLVFGHVHRPAHHPAWKPGRELFVLPAFDVGGQHLVHEDGVFRVRDGQLVATADFPARPLI